MKNKILKIIPIVFLLLAILSVNSYAVTYSSTDCTVESEGDITITVNASENLKNFDMTLTSYEGLTYISCSSDANAAVNTTTGAISYATLGDGIKTLATYKFKAPKVTEDKIYNVIFNINGTDNTAKVTVNAPKNQTPIQEPEQKPAKSNNANLKSLSVSPGELSPAFSSTRKTYTVYVESDVKELKISASTEDSKAKYSVSGHRQLEEGENPAKIVVTAEDGSTNTYTINIIKAKSLNLKLASLVLEGFTLEPEFDSEVYEYTISPEEYVENLSVTAEPQEEFTPIEITGNEDLQEGENIIIITLKSPDGTVTEEYKIKVINPVEELVEDVLGISEQEETELTTEDINRMKKQIAIRIILIVILCAIIAVLTYYLVQLYVKQKEDEEDDGYEVPELQKKEENQEQTEQTENTGEEQEKKSNFDIVDRRKYRRDSDSGKGRGRHF